MSFVVPECRVGGPLQRGPWIVHPLYEAQMRLFEDDSLEVIGVLSSRTNVLVAKAGKTRPRGPSVSNNSTKPLLALPGRRITKGQVLRTPILVPPSRTLEVPVVCHGGFIGGTNLSGDVVKAAVGVIVVTAFVQYLHLFGSVGLCCRAWRSVRVFGVGSGEPCVPQEIDDLFHNAKWKRVRSLGMGQEWISVRRGLRGAAISLGRRLVYLEIVRNDVFE